MGKKNKGRKKTFSCGAVTYRTGPSGKFQILLIKQFEHKENWGIPKGHMDEGESFEDCAVREVREETGVNVFLMEKLPDCIAEMKTEKKTVVSWLAVPNGDSEPKHDDPDNEVADARWFDIDDLPVITKYQRSLLDVVVEKLTELQKTTEGVKEMLKKEPEVATMIGNVLRAFVSTPAQEQ